MYGNIVMAAGIALSPLGLGLFFPAVLQAGALLVVVGFIIMALGK